MAKLAETQKPFLVRDIDNGTLPAKIKGESYTSYTIRLSRIYYLPHDEVQRAVAHVTS
jgi:hypothetical protein